MDLNELDEVLGLNAYRSDAGKAFYGLRNEVEWAGFLAGEGLDVEAAGQCPYHDLREPDAEYEDCTCDGGGEP